ncbi:tumor protein D53 homolog isoform X2 [Prorops nasuta]|uniref:tumor protein D53 homolog isoform X2 n=1 Tax=Prorops nasuta TaxID=863751 RepID=UPI0034CE6768
MDSKEKVTSKLSRLISGSEKAVKVSRNLEETGDSIENDRDYESLEYEEDVYYSNLSATPSFDDIDELDDEADTVIVHCWRGSSGEIDEINFEDPGITMEKELSERPETRMPDRKPKRSVKVIFMEFSKPILTKIMSQEHFKKFLELLKGEDALQSAGSGSGSGSGSLSPSSDNVANELQGLSLEEQERQKAEWSAELTKVEEEIQTLRHVLANKIRVSHDLKRKLGISVWKELSDDVNQGLKNVKESQVFQKTESVFKTTAEKTSSILGGFGSGITMKLGQMRNSDSFRSLEEKVGSAYENVKTKVVPSRSNSTQSFDEALRESEASRRASATPSVTSPTIPEDKMF